jgi:hypothetical protein
MKDIQKCIQRVLIYNHALKRRDSNVTRCYVALRERHGPPKRCDNEKCRFYKEPLIWNKKPLPVIVDHKSGNFRDSRPENLQFLCPNCAVQLPTHAGRNIGQVIFGLLESYGLRDGQILLMLGDSMNNMLDGAEANSARSREEKDLNSVEDRKPRRPAKTGAKKK